MEFKECDFVVLNDTGKSHFRNFYSETFIDRFSGILVVIRHLPWGVNDLWVRALDGRIRVTLNPYWFDPAVSFETEDILQDSCHLLPK